MIEIENLTKQFGEKKAVDGLSFRAESGGVTGFLGPNGAGKTTTMRMMLGLDHPTAGKALIDGKPLREHASPLHTVGALLNAGAAPPTMTATAHLRWIAKAGAIADSRVPEVLDLVGLTTAAGNKVSSMSLGMRQRLGIAAALLGDPGTLILDEPINGLDPDGVLWVRHLFKRLAAEGRTVLVSSHLMSEMQLTADQVVVIGRGKLVAQISMSDLQDSAQRAPIRLRVADPRRLFDALGHRHPTLAVENLPVPEHEHHPRPGARVRVTGVSAEEIGDAAAATGTPVYELTPERASLEDIFMQLTHDASDFVASDHQEKELVR